MSQYQSPFSSKRPAVASRPADAAPTRVPIPAETLGIDPSMLSVSAIRQDAVVSEATTEFHPITRKNISAPVQSLKMGRAAPATAAPSSTHPAADPTTRPLPQIQKRRPVMMESEIEEETKTVPNFTTVSPDRASPVFHKNSPVALAATVENTTKTESERDPSVFTIELPSNGFFYEKKLELRHIKGRHQAKFSRAAKEGNLSYLLDALSSTMVSRSAYDLTPGDFYFVMYWQRISSYPKNPMMVTWECSDPKHLAATRLPETDKNFKSLDSLRIESLVDNTTLETRYLDELDLSPFEELDQKYSLGFETMRGLAEWAEFQDNKLRIDKEAKKPIHKSEIELEELQWYCARALFLLPIEGRYTIEERMEVIRDMPPDDISELEKYMEAVTSYGVKEFVPMKCKECGAHHRVPISVDALSFLS